MQGNGIHVPVSWADQVTMSNLKSEVRRTGIALLESRIRHYVFYAPVA